ncbi:MAG: tetratricopeptide repeat protein [Desulfobacterales bacterium]|nr:tetratricopeptide repeat protein [Desulfobacterales bacterium]
MENFDLVICPETEPELAGAIRKDAGKLEWMIDGKKLVGQSGLLEKIGNALWKVSGLDAEKVLDRIEDARDEDEALRFVITGDRYQDLPWELLYHENPKIGFVSRHPRCVVSRCVRYRKEKQSPPEKNAGPLKLLLFISSPEGSDPEKSRLDFEKEEELLFDALDDPLRKGRVRIDVAEDGTLSTLISRLEQNRYHAVILSMHGTRALNRDKKEETGLVFEDDRTFGKSRVTGTDLADVLEKLPRGHRPALTVLSACLSAKAEESADSISGTALELHTRGFSQVLGMRLRVADIAASVFSSELFRNLALGESTGRAVTIARSEMASGKWLGISKDGAGFEEPFAQWTLPVLMDRTGDGSLLDSDSDEDAGYQGVMPSVIIGDGSILIPGRASFIGRRYEIRRYLREFLEAKKCFLMFAGPGGVGKTALAGLFARYLTERIPGTRVMGFQAPFSLESVFEPLREQAFDGEEEAGLKGVMETETDIRERIRRLLLSLSKRKNRPFLLVLDNLESLQDLSDLGVRDEDSQWMLKTVCSLSGNTRVLMTGRYSLPGLPEDRVRICRVSDAPYGDILRRMDRLRLAGLVSREEKQRIYKVLGGNHRAVEWMGNLLAEQKTEAAELLRELEKVEVPPNTPDEALETVKEAMRQNILFSALREHLTSEQDRLLRACSLYRIPVAEEGLATVDADRENHEGNRGRLLDCALLCVSENLGIGLDYYSVPPVVRSLVGETDFDREELGVLHEKMGRYHRYHGKEISRKLGDYTEAIHHFRVAEKHQDADELAETVSTFYYNRSGFAEANRLTEEIVEREEPPAPCWALNLYGRCQLVLGFPEKALHSFTKALSISPNKEDKGATLNNMSTTAYARGDYDTALKYLEQSLTIMQEIGNKSGEGAILNNISQIYDARGDYDAALKYLEQSLTIMQEIGDKSGESGCLNNIATIAYIYGDYNTALKYLEQNLMFRQEIGDKSGEGITLNNISQIYSALGDYNTALKYLEQSLTIRQEIGDKSGEGITLNSISLIYSASGDYDTALKYLEQSLTIRQEIGDKSGEGTILNNISQIYDARGDYDTALKYLEQSFTIMQEIGDKSGEGTILNNISQIYSAHGDYDTALKYLEQSLTIMQEIGDKSGMITTLHNMAEIAAEADDLEKAMTLWSEALSAAMETNNAKGIFHVASEMGVFFAQIGNKEEARKLLSLAVQTGKQSGFPNVNKVEEILKKV